MKALCHFGYHKYKTIDVPPPIMLDDEDILVKVKCCTDSMFSLNLRPVSTNSFSSSFGTKMTVMGLESSGVIEKIGKGALSRNLKIGDRVTGFYRANCGKCVECIEGRPTMCTNMYHPFGGMAEYFVWKASQIFPIPDTVDFDEACFAVVVARMLRAIETGKIRAGDSVAVIGANVTSMVLIQLLKISGASNITVFSSDSVKSRYAKQLGADYVFNPSTDRLSSVLLSLPESSRGFRAIIDTEGDASLLTRLMSLITNEGTLVIPIGYPPDISLPISLGELYMNEVSIRVVKDDPRYMSRAISILPMLRLKELITSKLTLDEAHLLFTNDFFKDNIHEMVYI